MRRYHFDLVDTVTDAGGSLLDDDDQAKRVAYGLALEVREQRPELIGHGYEILVRADNGEEISRAPIDRPQREVKGSFSAVACRTVRWI